MSSRHRRRAGRADSLLGLSRSLRQRYRELLAASAAPQSHGGVSPP
ncbi:MAG TPA: hypothetical protein VMT85_04495 [Thermoanaerobaculia bacterium]|nr:hypothetical protein [Thermoanaerobaculia bacterium]